MNREVHAPFCERPEVQFLRPTCPSCWSELRAFARLSKRLKTCFPGLRILLLLDGLYANGPVMQRCRDYHWQFMIVLKDQYLSTVWQELRALHALKPQAV